MSRTTVLVKSGHKSGVTRRVSAPIRGVTPFPVLMGSGLLVVAGTTGAGITVVDARVVIDVACSFGGA